jgi:indole-3-glycerol phosphate synthase
VSVFLQSIVDAKRNEVARRRQTTPLERLSAAPPSPVRSFRGALSAGGVQAIAEFKRRSPSKGPLRENADPEELAPRYEINGAAALSVLTDTEFFGGDDRDLQAARRVTRLPTLRKDFVIDAYQIHEARALGADAILLIVRLLDPVTLGEWLALAHEAGLDALVEAHDANEVRQAVDAGAAIVGVNSRDLDSFETDFERTLGLRDEIPADRIAVAESGIRDRGDVERLAAAGFDAFLVGETLMRAEDPGATLAALLGREPAGASS